MTDEYKKQLRECGVDVDETIARLLGREDMLDRLLKKFLYDNSYKMLEECMAEQRYEEAFSYAHTLKGVAGNLGLTPLYQSTSIVVEKLRGGVTEGVEEDFKVVQEKYEQIRTVIENNM